MPSTRPSSAQSVSQTSDFSVTIGTLVVVVVAFGLFLYDDGGRLDNTYFSGLVGFLFTEKGAQDSRRFRNGTSGSNSWVNLWP